MTLATLLLEPNIPELGRCWPKGDQRRTDRSVFWQWPLQRRHEVGTTGCRHGTARCLLTT